MISKETEDGSLEGDKGRFSVSFLREKTPGVRGLGA